jgi:hypothetical protein
MAARWWDRAPELLERALRVSLDRLDVSRYGFGYGRLELDSDDEPLNLRFRQIYPEGMVDPEWGPRGPLRVGLQESPCVSGSVDRRAAPHQYMHLRVKSRTARAAAGRYHRSSARPGVAGSRNSIRVLPALKSQTK